MKIDLRNRVKESAMAGNEFAQMRIRTMSNICDGEFSPKLVDSSKFANTF